MSYRHGMVKKKEPPVTIRYCLGCQEMTEWQYVRAIGHSRCKNCSGAFSTKSEISTEMLPVVA